MHTRLPLTVVQTFDLTDDPQVQGNFTEYIQTIGGAARTDNLAANFTLEPTVDGVVDPIKASDIWIPLAGAAFLASLGLIAIVNEWVPKRTCPCFSRPILALNEWPCRSVHLGIHHVALGDGHTLGLCDVVQDERDRLDAVGESRPSVSRAPVAQPCLLTIPQWCTCCHRVHSAVRNGPYSHKRRGS